MWGVQVVGVWEAPNPQARGLEGLLQPDPLPFNFTVPYNCLSTSRAHLACSFAHVLISLSAYLAGHVRGRTALGAVCLCIGRWGAGGAGGGENRAGFGKGDVLSNWPN